MPNVFGNGTSEVDNNIDTPEGLLELDAYGVTNTTQFGLFGTDDNDDPDFALVFQGSGFNSFDGNIADSGIINTVLHYDISSGSPVLTQTWSGLNITAAAFLAALHDPTSPTDAIANLLFGGADVINGGPGFADILYGYGGTDILIPFAGVAGDYANGGAGTDYIVTGGMLSGDIYDGGADSDLLVATLGGTISDSESPFNGYRIANVQAGTLLNFENISFAVSSPTDQVLVINASQLASGFTSNLGVRGSTEANIIQVMSTGGTVNLSNWSFLDWQSIVGGEYETNDDLVYVIGGSGVDTITGTSQGDRLEGQGGDDILNGGDGDDSIDGGAGTDQIYGGEGDDRIDVAVSGHSGAEVYDGGNGSDLLYVTFDSTNIVDLTAATITGFEGLEYDDGGGAWTFLVATILGTQAAAFSSTATLSGSRSDLTDILIINASAGATSLNLSGWDTSFWVNTDRVVFNASSSADTYVGTDHTDIMYGALGADNLNGGDGDDFVLASTALSGETYSGGSSGFDVLVVERGVLITDPEDLFTDAYSSDYTAGTLSGLDQISFGNPTSSGFLGHQLDSDKIAVFTGAQITSGFASNTSVVGVTGQTDVVDIRASGGTLNLSGWSFFNWNPKVGDFEEGEDLVLVRGSSGADTVTGSSTADVIFGNGGADNLSGGTGDDLLDGGAGVDTLDGGDGNDTLEIRVSEYVGTGETINGGNNTDLLYLTFDSVNNIDLSNSTITSIEAIEFANDMASTPVAVVATVSGAQAAALSSTLQLTGTTSGITDIFVVAAAVGGSTVNASLWTTSTWENGDRVSFIGNIGNDTYFGTSGFDSMYAGDGNDTLHGNGGNDFIIANAGDGNDTFNGGIGGTDTLVIERAAAAASSGPYTGLYISDFNSAGLYNLEQINFGNPLGGLPNQAAGKVATFISGAITGMGLTTVFGNTGQTDIMYITMSGASLNLTGLTLNNWNAGNGGSLDAGEDQFHIIGTASAETVTGTSGTDHIEGGGGNDVLAGGTGVDQLLGGAGDDRIVWDGSDDLANVLGGADTDTLVFAGNTTINSFNLTAHGFEYAEGHVTDPGSNPWSEQIFTYDSNWTLDAEETRNDDGTRTTLDYDQTNAANWSTAYRGYDNLDRLDVDVTTYDDGAHAVNDYDQASAFIWSTTWASYDSAGHLDTDVTTYDDGSHAVNDTDQNNAFNWVTSWASYDANGTLDTDVLTYDDGARAVRDFDNTSAFSWTSTWASYDTNGALDVDIFYYDDGTSAVRDLDQNDSFTWDTAWAGYDSLGRLDTDVITYDDGSYAVRDLDQANAFNWAQKWWLYDANDNLLASQTTYDDGSVG